MANYYTRASQAEMLGIPYVLVGDQCLRTDLSELFVCYALPSSLLSNWVVTAGGGTPTQQGLLVNLPTSLPVGAFYFATDVQILYVGTADGNAPTTALPLSGPAADVPTDAPAGFLYFATDTSVLYVALGQGSTLVVPPIHSGTLAQIGSLVHGSFYLTTDTQSLYIGTASAGNILVGPTPPNIHIVTVTLSSAQLLALSTTPVLIAPAPGAGLIIFPQSFMLEYVYGGIAYHTPSTTNNAFFGWVGEAINSVDAPIAFTGWGVFIEKIASVLAFGPVGNAANVGIVLANAENKGIQFGVPNALTLGNGTLKVTLVYTVIPA